MGTAVGLTGTTLDGDEVGHKEGRPEGIGVGLRDGASVGCLVSRILINEELVAHVACTVSTSNVLVVVKL